MAFLQDVPALFADGCIVLPVLIFVGTFILFAYFKGPKDSKRHKNQEFIDKNRAIITLGVPSSSHSTISWLLQARADANKGIKRVFGLNNSFTTASKDFRLAFTDTVRTHLKKKNVDYNDVVKTARTVISRKLSEERRAHINGSVPVALLVQNLTFKVALSVLFKRYVDVNRMDNSRVDAVTEQTNRLWLAIKNSDITQVADFTNQESLKKNLKEMLGTDPASYPKHDAESIRKVTVDDPSKDKPMNRIIPAYEAIWRVVLLGYLDCQRHLYHADDPNRMHHEVFGPALTALTSFLQNPTDDGTAHRYNIQPYDALSSFHAHDIAKEALRLYPSTKSVYRQRGWWQEIKRVICARVIYIPWNQKMRASVEKMHRLADGVWADRGCTDSRGDMVQEQRFWPRRWLRPQSALSKAAYVPFAVGPTQCSAYGTGFGPKIVAILIGVLAEKLHGFQIADTEPLEDSLREAEALPSGRENLNRWRVYFSSSPVTSSVDLPEIDDFMLHTGTNEQQSPEQVGSKIGFGESLDEEHDEQSTTENTGAVTPHEPTNESS